MVIRGLDDLGVAFRKPRPICTYYIPMHIPIYVPIHIPTYGWLVVGCLNKASICPFYTSFHLFPMFTATINPCSSTSLVYINPMKTRNISLLYIYTCDYTRKPPSSPTQLLRDFEGIEIPTPAKLYIQLGRSTRVLGI